MLMVAAGSCRYMGEIAWKIAVWSTPAASPTSASPATRNQAEYGGETNARYSSDADASPQAKASVHPTPLRSSSSGETRTEATIPTISPTKYQPMIEYSERMWWPHAGRIAPRNASSSPDTKKPASALRAPADASVPWSSVADDGELTCLV